MDCDNEELKATKNINEIDNLEEKYVEKLKEIEKKYKDDNEKFHYCYDELILEFLEEKGFTKIVEQFKETRRRNIFWYA